MMWRSRLFWRFFLSIMAVVLFTSVVSVRFERYVSQQYSPQRINHEVEALLAFRNQLEDTLHQGELDAAVQQLQNNPKQRRQLLIFDDYDNEILGRESLTKRTLDKHFSHPLNSEFRRRNESLHTAVDSIFGQRYYIQVLPKVSFSPWTSPRVAGAILRSLLLISLSAIACYWLTRTLTRRIHLLQQATHRLASHDFHTQIPLHRLGRDELGQLGQDFQHMAMQLADSEQARKQMLSDISHELRSPLARQQVAIEIARTRQAQGNDIATQLDRMETESQRLNDLIGQIIHIQQLTLDKNTNAHEAITLPSLLQPLIDDVNYEYQQQNKQATLTLHNDEKAGKNRPIWTLYGEAELLLRAFENVIRNAMSHTHSGTTVTIALSHQTDSIQITISDCGDGIANAGDTDKIFQPFTRLDSSRNRQTGGYGLGLAISKAIIERHNGSISAANRPKGSGLVITINLPATS